MIVTKYDFKKVIIPRLLLLPILLLGAGCYNVSNDLSDPEGAEETHHENQEESRSIDYEGLREGNPPSRLAFTSNGIAYVSSDGRLFLLEDGGGGISGGGLPSAADAVEVVITGERIRSVSCTEELGVSDRHFAIVTESGRLYALGSNDGGQLGLGDTLRRDAPTLVDIPGNERVVSAEVASRGLAVLTESGRLFFAGQNFEGRFGEGFPVDQSAAVSNLQEAQIPGVSAVRSVSLGPMVSAVIDEGGRLFTSGNNSGGRLGAGLPPYSSYGSPSIECSYRFVPADIDRPVSRVAYPGGGYPNNGNLITEDGELYFFGALGEGSVGSGQVGYGYASSPMAINLPVRAAALSIGGNHRGIVSTDGRLFLTGRQGSGEFGIGSDDLEFYSYVEVYSPEAGIDQFIIGNGKTALISGNELLIAGSFFGETIETFTALPGF